MDAGFDVNLKHAITFDFVHHVKPESFLCVVHSVNYEVLTENDLSMIKAETAQKGDILGAYKLLDYITVYHNWFECVIGVLKHPEIKLNAIASKLESIRDEINSKYMNETVTLPYSAKALSARSAMPQWMPPNKSANSDPLSTMELEADGPADNDESEVEEIIPGNASQGAVDEDTDSNEKCQQTEQCAVSVAKDVLKKKNRPLKHGPEYDFTNNEIADLHAFTGWQPGITELQVREALDKHLHEDGHFLIFFWERKRRPAISVSFKGSIKTFLLHKKPKTVDKPTLYYIDKRGPHDVNLKNLINCHIQHGIVDMGSPLPQSTIFLQKPIAGG